MSCPTMVFTMSAPCILVYRSYHVICQANDPLFSEPSGLLQGALNQPPAQPSEPNHCDAGVMLHGATEVPA